MLSRLSPFEASDVTVGVENEFQAAVSGAKENVDLPLGIEHSSYFQNLVKRAERGDLPFSSVSALQGFLENNQDRIWENSWVRFPRHLLSPYADTVLRHDLLADKSCPQGPNRSDCHRFLFHHRGEKWLRIPVSYLLKLSLADGISRSEMNFPLLFQAGKRLMRHFISDNTSPEITSFSLAGNQNSILPGEQTARETCRRFFFTQLLVCYANRQFMLENHGQTCHLYFAPNPPLRQKKINELVSDAFYRELFLNPCLSGWERGEEKKLYMELCHRTLSRSQLNGLAKLREAGIITRNLVILPNTSNTCLANNGTHITFGSKILTRLFADDRDRTRHGYEKYFGDLVIKIVEHFLPLFVNTVSAAPYRLSFSDFHPEKVLGFLPHELDYTHLRMIWRRWKKKADLRFFGHSMTPLGPERLDHIFSRLFRLRGDYVPDIRLVDYLVALQSVENGPALDGTVGNQQRLKNDLAAMGVFDSRMAMYLPYRIRERRSMGFSGFEGRHYSLFPSQLHYMAQAVNLQLIVTALAWHWVSTGTIRHHHIPDDPFTESERRQIFFASAIGLPTFFVRADTRNILMRRILAKTKGQRHSRRYKGYIRVGIKAWKQACLALLKEEHTDFFATEAVQQTLADMKSLLDMPEHQAADVLTRGIVREAGCSGPAIQVDADTFNHAAERYYRTTLWTQHMREAVDVLKEDARSLENYPDKRFAEILSQLTEERKASDMMDQIGIKVMNGQARSSEIRRLILLTMLTIEREYRISMGEEP
ncbi:hypothetical protein [Desulfolithobacter sp.]